jgi:hypothetical protein
MSSDSPPGCSSERFRQLFESLPTVTEIRERLDENAAEKKLLSRLLRIAVQRERSKKQEVQSAS